jgi:hypothetical protein
MVVGSFAHKGGQCCNYGLILSRSPVIIHDARLEICDTPLTLISTMRQRACRFPVYVECRPIPLLWIDVTMQPFDYQKDQTKIVDAHVGDIPTDFRWVIILLQCHTVIIDGQYSVLR